MFNACLGDTISQKCVTPKPRKTTNTGSPASLLTIAKKDARLIKDDIQAADKSTVNRAVSTQSPSKMKQQRLTKKY